ncbi:MAG: ribonuclease P protein component [Patescibacteria group bacterium]
MLAKKGRINKHLLREILKRGTKIETRFILLKTLKINNQKSPKFAFIIPQRTAKKSTARNKIKRRARHITKKISHLFNSNSASVFLLKKGIDKLKFKELEDVFLEILQRAKTI